jgi:hypothetical protein
MHQRVHASHIRPPPPLNLREFLMEVMNLHM